MPSRDDQGISIVCYGETLWDVLPRGIFLGGAPLNMAYHLSRNGVRALPVSAVGRDFLGAEALRRIGQWGLDSRFISRRAERPTGTVQAVLDPQGAAHYRIAENVAWDWIGARPSLLREAAPAALVFGTLALRQKHNRDTLQRLITAWPSALRVLDLNLRAPFDHKTTIALALKHAQVVKLNDEELARIVSVSSRTPKRWESAARRVAELNGVERVCVTAGATGAGLLWDGRWYWEKSQPVTVRDTIGAGDSFLAALLAAILGQNKHPADALPTACRLGEFVASRDGATPSYTLDNHGRPRDQIS